MIIFTVLNWFLYESKPIVTIIPIGSVSNPDLFAEQPTVTDEHCFVAIYATILN